jgi:hypothetical protein
MLSFGKAVYKADHQINSDLLRTGSMRLPRGGDAR